ncbi:MAG: hypothetical protein IPN39_17985 [Chitinophagaceae bacterium]|nr:hypothetical protein [Chitinophagaceae bacterium]
MDFMLQESFDAHDEVVAVVQSMMNEIITPFTTAQLMSAFVFDTFDIKRELQVWKHK